MPIMNTGDILLFTMKWRMAGQTLLNTCHYRYDANVGPGDDFEDFAPAMTARLNAADNVIDSMLDVLSNDITLEEIRLQPVHPVRYAPYVLEVNKVGQVATPAVPVNCAAVFTKRSLLATRYGIGSWHQGGIPAAVYNRATGLFTFADLNVIATQLGNAFEGNFIPDGMTGFVHGILWNYQTPLRITDIAEITPQLSARVMRRRTVGLGI